MKTLVTLLLVSLLDSIAPLRAGERLSVTDVQIQAQILAKTQSSSARASSSDEAASAQRQKIMDRIAQEASAQILIQKDGGQYLRVSSKR